MIYELGIATSQTATGSPIAEFRAGAASPMSLLELGIFLNAATASTIQLGRPGNAPAGGTPQTASNPLDLRSGGGASLGGIIIASWTTAPTIPAAGNITRKVALPAAIGNGVVFTWAPGELVISPTTSSGLIIWSLSAISVLNLYAKWAE